MIDIDTLTIGEAKQLRNTLNALAICAEGATGTPEITASRIAGSHPALGKLVLIRTRCAGIHFGTLCKVDGQNITLAEARRIWSWKGAFTLNEIADKGIDKDGSKVSASVGTIYLLDAIEIIPISVAASKKLEACHA